MNRSDPAIEIAIENAIYRALRPLCTELEDMGVFRGDAEHLAAQMAMLASGDVLRALKLEEVL